MNAPPPNGHRSSSDRGLRDVETQAGILDELTRIRELQTWRRESGQTLRSFDQAARSRLGEPAAGDSSPVTDAEPILALLRAGQVALLRHPDAAAFVFRALAHEGRAYAATADGEQRAAALAADPTVDNLRRLWEATTLNVLGDDLDTAHGGGPGDGIPADWIALLLDAAGSTNFDSLLDNLNPGGA